MKTHVITPCALPPELMAGARSFFRSVHRNVPNTRIFALTPPGTTASSLSPDVMVTPISLYGPHGKTVPALSPIDNWFYTLALLVGSDYGLNDDDWVLISDCRDAIVQDWPWTHPITAEPGRVHVFAETSMYPASVQHAQAPWLHALYPMGVPDSVWQMPIICCGVHMGRWAPLQAHFRRMCRWMECTRPFYGRDQSMLIALAALNPDRYFVHLNETGPVMHMCQQYGDVKDAQGATGIFHPNGYFPAVVHQYDRWTHAVEFVRKQYGD